VQKDTNWPIFPIETPARILLSGADYRGLRPDLSVSEGERISAGQIVFADRKRRWIRIPSPVSGKVVSIERGPRRTLKHIEIEVSDGPETTRPSVDVAAKGAPARQALIDAGLWSAIRQRPFDSVSDPDIPPKAILVTAMFSDHTAPSLAEVMAHSQTEDDFVIGLQFVSNLAACPAVLCHVRGDVLPVPKNTGLKQVAFGLDHSDRFVGTHVRKIAPASTDAPVWYVNWQDVVAIGHFARTGVVPHNRLLCLRGASSYRPVLIRTPVGTPISAITAGSGAPALPSGTAMITGDPLQLKGAVAVGRYDDRLSVVEILPDAPWTTKHPRPKRFFQSNANRIGPIIPHRQLGHSLPEHPAPIAFLRALAAGDVETALRLGCLDLAEPDVAACSLTCVSGNDYPALLRRVLDDLAGA
jgi:Na+-transporting NADH:ubiquinone oxidoreductase subunit A